MEGVRVSSAIAPFLVSVLLAPGVAHADEAWLLSLEGDLALPVLSPTMDRFHPGGAGSVAVHRSLTDVVLIGARLRGGFLGDGPAPTVPGLADPGVGDLFTLGLSLRLRPFAPMTPAVERGTGGFVEIGAGAALTGGLVRPSVELGLGWGFAIDDVDLAPVARWVTVFEVDNQLDDRPANVLTLGLEVTLFDARPVPEAPPPPPIGDRDHDGLLDNVDECPDEPEDADDFQDEDGCPDPDNDGDGILDEPDQCPLEPEDMDGWFDDDGCPDPDNDGDGFLDGDDQCPDEAEVVNGVEDEDGCPDEGLIELVDDRIVLDERVLFGFSRATLRASARPSLEAIITLFEQHPEWTEVRIEGHADTRGTVAGNWRLSTRRARRVRNYLVDHGIDEERLSSVGLGSTRPAVDASTERQHERNRRVELVVVPVETEPVTDHAEEGATDVSENEGLQAAPTREAESLVSDEPRLASAPRSQP